MRMIIPAAGLGSRLAPLTDGKPKCMVEVGGVSLLDRHITRARGAGIDVVAIGGYKVEQLRDRPITVVENKDYATTNMVRSMFCAESLFGDGFVMAYGDIAYSPRVLQTALDSPHPIGVVVDQDWLPYWQERFDDPLSDAETLRIDADGNLLEIGQKPTSLAQIEAQYIGMVVFKGDGVEQFRAAYRHAEAEHQAGRKPFGGPRSLDGLYMTDLLMGMIGRGCKLATLPIHGGWAEVDSLHDLSIAEKRAAAGLL